MYKVDVYLRVRRAVMVEGMSMREADRVFGLHRDTVRKMLAYSVPPGYRRQSPPRKPKLDPYTGVIDRILEDDLRACLRSLQYVKLRLLPEGVIMSHSIPATSAGNNLPGFFPVWSRAAAGLSLDLYEFSAGCSIS